MKQPYPSRILIMAVILISVHVLPALPHKFGAAEEIDCSGNLTPYRVLREIEDLGTHQRWLLIRNMDRAAGPAILVKASYSLDCALLAPSSTNSSSGFQLRVLLLPVIHAGDSIVLSDRTSLSEAELEAIALERAAVGGVLRARLKFGGFTVRAIAVAPGRATLAPEIDGRRP